MSRLWAFITNKPPVAGIEYTLDGRTDCIKTLTEVDICNGIVRVRWKHSEPDYLTYRTFHVAYGVNKHEQRWRQPTKTKGLK